MKGLYPVQWNSKCSRDVQNVFNCLSQLCYLQQSEPEFLKINWLHLMTHSITNLIEQVQQPPIMDPTKLLKTYN